MLLILLSSIKLFHKTVAEYLRVLIPKFVVFIWGVKMPPLETLRVIWEFMSLFKKGQVDQLVDFYFWSQILVWIKLGIVAFLIGYCCL